MIKATVGFPKGSNFYGNRVIIVLASNLCSYDTGNTVRRQGRITAGLFFKSREYSTGSTLARQANIFDKLKDLHLRSEKYPDLPIDRDLYKLVYNQEMLRLAYETLKSNPGQMTPGINPETLDGISAEVLDKIIVKLRSENYQFSPGRKIQIDKASGGKRSLTITSPRDKLVQQAMKMILEAVFEPLFLDYSHGFRPQRGCHTALKFVSQKFQHSA